MIRNPSPEFSLFDQALLRCSDGHCLFDDKRELLSWSVSFEDFYPQLNEKIIPGYRYEDFVRDLFAHNVLQNLKQIDDVSLWIAQHLNSLKNGSGEFVHHLQDGRYMSVRHTNLTNGYWFFGAHDITASMLAREALTVSKQKYERFAKLSSDWFWELDKDLCYVYFSSHNQALGELGKKNLVGESRIDHLLESAIDNEQLREHIAALEEHRELDTIVTWKRDVDPDVFVQIKATPQFDEQGEFLGFLGNARDVTAEYGLKTQLEYQAAHDELTGLANRRAFSNYVNISLKNRSLTEAANESATRLHNTLIFVDLDQFKMVNDNAGHLAGDELLTDITRLFKRVYASADDIIARLGGDEFAVLSDCDIDTAKEKAEELIGLIGDYRLSWDERTFAIGASAGVVALDDSSQDDSELLSKADCACYSAKMAGRNQVHVYDGQSAFESNQIDEISKLEIINDALANKKMCLYLQPIVATVESGEKRKYEVLLRLVNSKGEVVPPGEIIPVAEKYDRMQQLDLWVVEQSILGLKKFHELGEPVALSVNLSGNTLSNESTLNRIIQLVEKYEVDAKSLCFEITETSAIKDVEKACRFISEIRGLGCQFSLDDFGSGLSSFSYLRSLQVDYLKIDGCFVTTIVEDKANQAIVQAFNTLAHQLGMKTVAEYVENRSIADLLTQLGVDYLQGYELGKPTDIQEYLDLCTEPQRLTGT